LPEVKYIILACKKSESNILSSITSHTGKIGPTDDHPSRNLL
jgi:hypothetical protein